MTFVTHTVKQCSHPLRKLSSVVIDVGNVQHAVVEASIQWGAKVLITLLDAGQNIGVFIVLLRRISKSNFVSFHVRSLLWLYQGL